MCFILMGILYLHIVIDLVFIPWNFDFFTKFVYVIVYNKNYFFFSLMAKSRPGHVKYFAKFRNHFREVRNFNTYLHTDTHSSFFSEVPLFKLK